MTIFAKFQHFAYIEERVVEKYAKFDKYAKPKIFMPTTSKKRQTSKIWHKNMPVGNTADSAASNRKTGIILVCFDGKYT